MEAPVTARSPTAISLFTGAGGLDYGFEAAGFRTAVALERDARCCQTLRKNRDWPIIERPIAEVGTSELLAAAGLAREIRCQLLGQPRAAGLKLALSKAPTPPPATTAQSAVPQEFLSLRGKHQAHPGTGLGPGAQNRILADT